MAKKAEAGSITDLWSVDFSLPNLTTPRAVLAAQADYLDSHTSGVLDADVETAVLQDRMAHAFTLRATKLPEFRETILTATHGARLFPVAVQAAGAETPISCEDMRSFESAIRQVLGSGETAMLIRSLLTQSREIDLVRAEQREAAGLNGAGGAGHVGIEDRVSLN